MSAAGRISVPGPRMSSREPPLLPHLADVDGDGVAEQHQHQGQRGEDLRALGESSESSTTPARRGPSMAPSRRKIATWGTPDPLDRAGQQRGDEDDDADERERGDEGIVEHGPQYGSVLAVTASRMVTWIPMPTSEPTATALLLTICGILLLVSVLFSRASQRIGVPIALLFLLVGMLAGSEGIGGIAVRRLPVRLPASERWRWRSSSSTADSTPRWTWCAASGRRRGSSATVGVRAHRRRSSRSPAQLWRTAPGPPRWCSGAVVSSTDAAAAFAVLRGSGLQLKRRVGRDARGRVRRSTIPSLSS